MIYGSNRVEEYSAVAAFSVETRDSGIISGGGGDSAVVVDGTTFSWVYDPNNLEQSGFTGVGWFDKTPGSPIAESGQRLEAILDGFANGNRTNLDDVFTAWQAYIEDQQAQGTTGIVSDFVNTLVLAGGSGCWSS